jgi:hypothetical protein
MASTAIPATAKARVNLLFPDREVLMTVMTTPFRLHRNRYDKSS